MTARAYYNEIDPAAAHVLRHLIAEGVIAPGDVDTRSIKEVSADDVRGYTQCHFFAGGGLWSVASRLAGWPDERPIWTGSCPCQPFSVAGKGAGSDDPRHLWPDFFRLIRSARPPVVVGEQVAGSAGYGWFDGVAADLEGEGFAARTVDIPACAVDAPHIRQRLYWCAVANGEILDGRSRPEQPGNWPVPANIPVPMEHGASIGRGEGQPESELRSGRGTIARTDAQSPLGDSFGAGLEGYAGHVHGAPGWREQAGPITSADGRNGLHANANGSGRAGWQETSERGASERTVAERDLPRRNGSFWSGSEWIVCHDGKARRAQSGIRLLVDGFPGRADVWRIAGNAIVPQVAAEVIGALMDVLPEWRAA